MKIVVKLIVGLLLIIPLTLKGQELTNYKVKNERKALAIEVASERGMFIRKQLEDGTIIELQDIDESGRLIYYKTLNRKAANTTRTNRLYAGSTLGLDLSGRNMTIGMWDGGSVQADHVEFAGRLQQFDNPNDKSRHASHVLGTLIAKGINPEARGMAYNAIAAVYDFNIDDPEMAEAAAGGLLISNHSYGEVLGWTYNGSAWEWFGNNEISSVEDYRFGLYNSASVSWDKIAFQNPYYLIVKSAGNDRSDIGGGTGAPADGPYDLIDPQGVAKNILTVGAVQSLDAYNNPSDIKITSFSSWGPTDDGRIKPDLVGMGQDLFSTAANGPDSYTTLSGTSMSSPNVAGSLLLLQELYHRLNNRYMLSATLKGVAIHTALEAGNNPGPDYIYGWGLFNAEDAAKHILLSDNEDFIIEETELTNGSSFSRQIILEKDKPAVFTIAWTDTPGQPNGAVLDPEVLALVNDLDLRVIGPDATEYLPWVLNPESKNSSKGDNFRDNIEKIEFIPTVSGVYTIQVSHKATLDGGTQNFSLIASSQTPQNALQTLYYIGSNGQWDDPRNWSRQINGSPVNRVPNANDIVLIGNNRTIDLDEDATCWGVSSYNNQTGTVRLNGHTLSIASHVVLNEGTSITGGTLRFSNPEGTLSSLLKASGEGLSSATVELDAENFTLNIDSDLKVKRIVHKQGTLNLGENQIMADSFEITGSASKTIEIRNGSIRINNKMLIEDAVSLNIYNSPLELMNGSTLDISTSLSNQFPKIITNEETILKGTANIDALEQRGKLSLDGIFQIESWVIQGDVAFLGTSVPNEVEIGTLMQIDHSKVPGLITLSSISATARIISENANKFCFNGVAVENIGVTGNTKFVVDAGSTLTNADGWIQQECSTVLAADFSFKFACEQGITEFTDISDGDPISWSWDFGDNSEISTVPAPEHVYSESGDYMVTLTITDGEETSAYTKMITVIPTSLNRPEIIETGDGLRSSSFASNYQWYFDGEPIEGAKTFELKSPLADGIYEVEIANSTCRLRSDPFRIGITSIEVDVDEVQSYAVFPNPTSGDLTIRGGEVPISIIQVIDQQGRILISKEDVQQTSVTLELDRLKSGIYFVLIERRDDIEVHRIVKE